MLDEVTKEEASLREELAEWKKSGVTEMQSLAVVAKNAMILFFA